MSHHWRVPLLWRMSKAEDSSGFFMYFDASREMPGVRELTEDEKSLTLDKQRSVRGLIRSDQLELEDGCEAEEAVSEAPSSFLETLWEGTDHV